MTKDPPAYGHFLLRIGSYNTLLPAINQLAVFLADPLAFQFLTISSRCILAFQALARSVIVVGSEIFVFFRFRAKSLQQFREWCEYSMILNNLLEF